MPDVDLGVAGREVARELVLLYGPGADVERLATLAGHAWEQVVAARVQLAADGLVVEVGRGKFMHPSLKTARENMLAFNAILKTLRQRPTLAKAHRPTKIEQHRRDHAGTPIAGKLAKYIRPA
jgi:hypothetical protein